MRNTVVNLLDHVPVTIANGASITGDINLGGLRLFGIVMPASWTTANLTFQASHDFGTSWSNLYDANGTEVTVTAATSRYIALDPVLMAALQYIRVRSGTSGTPVNQGAQRSLELVLRSL